MVAPPPLSSWAHKVWVQHLTISLMDAWLDGGVCEIVDFISLLNLIGLQKIVLSFITMKANHLCKTLNFELNFKKLLYSLFHGARTSQQWKNNNKHLMERGWGVWVQGGGIGPGDHFLQTKACMTATQSYNVIPGVEDAVACQVFFVLFFRWFHVS